MFKHRTFFLIFSLFLTLSCGKKGDSGSPDSNLSAEQASDAPSATTPLEASTFEVNIKMSGFTKDQEDKILAAADLIKRIVATNEFKSRVINKKYGGKKTFVDNDGKTNRQIYKRILAGNEKLGIIEKNNTMDLDLKAFTSENNVIGYTYPNIQRIYLNKKFLNSFKANQVAANLFHEWLHKLGFKHSFDKTPERAHSVPYAIGYIIRNLGSNL